MMCRRVLLPLALLMCIAAVGCRYGRSSGARNASPQEVQVARGVVFRRLEAASRSGQESPVCVLDADLTAPGVRARVVAGPVDIRHGRPFAEARYVTDWCRSAGALGGVNGGFFGATQGESKEVVGLLATGGTVRSAGRLVRSRTNPGMRFARCVLGFDSKGKPRIGWAVAERGRQAILTDYEAPQNPEKQRYWTVESAVACGPRLIADGKTHISDRAERLVSPPAVARTFVGYDVDGGSPRHFALAIGLQTTYEDAADFLKSYFRRYHGTGCAEAMCLDGGSSSQMAYRTSSGYQDVRPTFVTVPTAVLIVAPDRSD